MSVLQPDSLLAPYTCIPHRADAAAVGWSPAAYSAGLADDAALCLGYSPGFKQSFDRWPLPERHCDDCLGPLLDPPDGRLGAMEVGRTSGYLVFPGSTMWAGCWPRRYHHIPSSVHSCPNRPLILIYAALTWLLETSSLFFF
ncbi:MAG: hypothetical protein U0401_12870 [Anaerolineae bacterium]